MNGDSYITFKDFFKNFFINFMWVWFSIEKRMEANL